MLSGNTAVIAETGDSWFNCQKLKLPKGCGYDILSPNFYFGNSIVVANYVDVELSHFNYRLLLTL